MKLNRLASVDYSILDVKATKWHDDYAAFKTQTKDMEVKLHSKRVKSRFLFQVMYINVVTNAFESVSTVRSAVEVLFNLYITSVVFSFLTPSGPWPSVIVFARLLRRKAPKFTNFS